MGVNWKAVKALVQWDEGRRRLLFQRRKKERNWVLDGLWIACSLSDDQRQMRTRRAEVLSAAEGVEAGWGFKSSTGGSSSWQRGQPEATRIECPPEILLRAERGRR